MPQLSIESKSIVKPWSRRHEDEIVELSCSDQTQVPMHIPCMYAYERVEEAEKKRMRDALAQALDLFYPVAGRLRKRPRGCLEIQCSNQGVLFIQASAQGKVADLMAEITPKPLFDKLNPAESLLDVLNPSNPERTFEETPLLLVQVTVFECGGIILTAALHHKCGDIVALDLLVKAWAEICRQGHTSCVPTFDKSTFKCRDPPSPAFPHIEYRTTPLVLPDPLPPMTAKMICFTPQSITHLRSTSPHCQHYTKFELVTAHLWQCITRSRNLLPHCISKVCIAVDGRKRFCPPLNTTSFFGNAVYMATSVALAADLIHQDLSFACKEIHRAILRMDDEYLRSANNWIATRDDVMSIMPAFDVVSGPDLAVSSWARFGLYETDFGWGKPVYAGVVPSIIMDGEIWIQPLSDDGYMRCWITLTCEVMENLLNNLLETSPCILI